MHANTTVSLPSHTAVRDLDGLRRSGSGALGKERRAVTADHLDARPLGQPGRQARCLPVGQQIHRPASLGVDQHRPVGATPARRVLVDAHHSRGRRAADREAPRPAAAPCSGSPTPRTPRPAWHRHVRPAPDRPRQAPPAAARSTGRGAGSTPRSARRRSAARTTGCRTRNAVPAGSAGPVSLQPTRRRETAGRSCAPESTNPRRPDNCDPPPKIWLSRSPTRRPRRPTAPRHLRSTETAAPPTGAPDHPRFRTVGHRDSEAGDFRATFQRRPHRSIVTHRVQATEVEPEPVLANKATAGGPGRSAAGACRRSRAAGPALTAVTNGPLSERGCLRGGC